MRRAISKTALLPLVKSLRAHADVLLDAGLALESVAFREDDGFEATPIRGTCAC
jgi:hypothetical protein